MAKAKSSTLNELKDLRAQLEIEVSEAQVEVSIREYSVDLENTQNVNAILKQIDKSYSWNIKNAAFLINLYDSLIDQKRISIVAGEKTTSVSLNSLQLNTLYTVLTNITGTGIEAARTFTKLLTNIGSQISDALKEMADDNAGIQQKHVKLAELDIEIDNMTVPTLATEELAK